MNIVDSLLVAQCVPNLLPNLLIVILELIKLDTKVHHSPLVVLALIKPFVKDDIFFEESCDNIPHVVSVVSSILSEGLAHLNYIVDMELVCLVL